MEKNAARLICVAGSGFPAPGGVAKPRCGTNCIVLSWSLSKIAHLKAASLVCIASGPVAIAAAALFGPSARPCVHNSTELRDSEMGSVMGLRSKPRAKACCRSASSIRPRVPRALVWNVVKIAQPDVRNSGS